MTDAKRVVRFSVSERVTWIDTIPERVEAKVCETGGGERHRERERQRERHRERERERESVNTETHRLANL